MATEAQIEANRRNAQKSTGPKTEEGKAAASTNALRHGLFARHVVCFDEKARDFEAFHDALSRAFAPADAIEEQLVERVILCAWRIRRISRMEAKLINSYEACDVRVYRTELASVVDRAAHKLTSLSRYETALDRAIQRAQATLERRQARRRGEFVPAPIAVEVTGLESLAEAIAPPAENENDKTNPIFEALHQPASALPLHPAEEREEYPQMGE